MRTMLQNQILSQTDPIYAYVRIVDGRRDPGGEGKREAKSRGQRPAVVSRESAVLTTQSA